VFVDLNLEEEEQQVEIDENNSSESNPTTRNEMNNETLRASFSLEDRH